MIRCLEGHRPLVVGDRGVLAEAYPLQQITLEASLTDLMAS